MNHLLHLLLITLALALMSGCSQGTAAPIQTPPAKPMVIASLAPAGDAAVPATVKIPQAPRVATPILGKPTTAKDITSEPVDSVDDGDDAILEQDRKQEKMNRKTYKQDGKSEKAISTSKYASVQTTEEKKSTDSPSKPESAKPDSAKKEETAPGATSVPAAESTATPVVAATTPAASPAATAFTVTYGSGTTTQPRTFKKPAMPGNVPSWFSENDKDGDGQLTMNEWPSDRLAEFTKYDRNNDGIITLEEALRTVPKAAPVVVAAPATTPAATTATTATPSATTPPKPAVASATPSAPATGGAALTDEEATRRVERTFSFVDSNKDGVLDAAEIEKTQGIKSVDWKKYDLNKDGKLDKAEAIALYKAEGNNMRGGGMGGGGMGGGGGGPWGNRSPEEMQKTMFDNMDKNKTGKITKDQLPGMWQGRFAEMDTNKDGFVDFEEFKAAAAKMMQGRGQGGPGGGGGRGGDNGGGRGGPGGGRGGDNGGGGRGGRTFGGGN